MKKNNTEIYNIFKNKENISFIQKNNKGYFFKYMNQNISLTTAYTDLFDGYVYLLEFMDKIDINKESQILASFQKEMEEDEIYFSKLFEYLEKKRSLNEA